MDYAGLKAEIALPQYADMDDDQIATLLNTANITVWSDVPIGNVVGYLAITGKLNGITKYNGTDPTARSVCETFTTLISTATVTSFQLSSPGTLAAVSGMLDVLVGATLISATDKATMLGMGQTAITRAQQLDFGDHHDMSSEIKAARRWGD